MNNPIVLLTDFGHQDPFVGIMKGVILGLAPKVRVVDLCHEVPPQNVRTAAFHLRQSVAYFPNGALFVIVVDPGVGSGRRILWARTRRQQFLAPDNGVLDWLEQPIVEARAVINQKLWLKRISSTFHGRDIFAPVAARLSLGVEPKSLGPAAEGLKSLPFPPLAKNAGRVRGQILCVDRFGNAVTNLTREDVRPRSNIIFKNRSLGQARDYYAQARPREALALFGSAGFLELSVRQGNFAAKFKAKSGDFVDARN